MNLKVHNATISSSFNLAGMLEYNKELDTRYGPYPLSDGRTLIIYPIDRVTIQRTRVLV